MSKSTLNKYLAMGLLVVSTVAVGTTANAASGDGSTTMTVLAELTVTNNIGVAFGNINRPSSGSYQFKLKTNDAIDDLANTSDGFHAGGTPTAGKFTIAGEASQNVDVSVSYTAFTDAAITIDAAYIDTDQITMSATSTTGTLNATTADLIVWVGADVSVGAAAAKLTHTSTVTVTANYM